MYTLTEFKLGENYASAVTRKEQLLRMRSRNMAKILVDVGKSPERKSGTPNLK